ncbi:DUF3618 domain-containing protein [Stutzerimonas urumqiensis]|uniref:DUF3618 domain-containing protein n=1 Tax=Stutzerimonas urumqiensis TaxID=638269 RepID=UPI003BAC638A
MSTNTDIDREAQKDPETLEREIDQQRAEITDIVTALENKLSPGQMIDTALGYAKGNGGEFVTNLGNTLKANPVPTLLTGIGLVWLMAGQNRQPTSTYSTSTGPSMRDRMSEKTAGLKERGASVKDRATQMRSSVSSSLGSARSRVSDTGRHASENLRHRAGQARGGFNRMLNEQPLALGAIGIALGALVAACVPPTRREDEMMGEARDQMKERLREQAEVGYQKASAVGEQVATHVKQDMSNGASQPSASRTH